MRSSTSLTVEFNFATLDHGAVARVSTFLREQYAGLRTPTRCRDTIVRPETAACEDELTRES